MAVSLKPLHRQVMVITGATSGIGLATARMAAEHGTRLVLAARNAVGLDEVTRQIDTTGGQAVAVEADVTRREDVRRIADTAVARFGGFDTWVNNAGLSVWARLEQISDDDARRLFDTNFWGLVYGSQVAVEHLKRHGGALINMGSVASDVALPLQGMYAASKHAVEGFTDALRMELMNERAPVSVTLIRPHSINTPFPHHAKNYTDREPKLPAPVYAPEEVARAVLHAATHPVRDLYVGTAGRLMSGLARHFPRTMDWLGARVQIGQQLRDEPPRNPEGTLYRAGTDVRVHGDEPAHIHQVSLYDRAVRNPWLTGALVTAAVGAAAALLGGRSDRKS